jgi:hypothetical protein
MAHDSSADCEPDTAWPVAKIKTVLTDSIKTSILALALMFAGCSEAPKKAVEKAPEKPPEAVTGQYALHQMYTVARSWAPDAQPLRLNSILLPEVKSEPGKAGAWQATFVSQQRGRARSYTHSVIEGEGNLHKGTFAGPEESWSGARGPNKPFLMAAVRTDTDAAYKTTLAKGQDYAKKHPEMPINVLLESGEFPNPAWRIIWGQSVGTSSFSIYVDASTGDYVRTMR